MNGELKWIAVKNVSGEVIPAHAAMEPVSIGRDGILQVTKPNRDDSNSALINSEAAIAINGGGQGTYGWPMIALYNDSDPPTSNQQAIGTRAGYWQLHTGYEGFLVWGMKSSDKYVVQRDVTCRQIGGPSTYYYYGGRVIDCLGCSRATTASISIYRPIYTASICTEFTECSSTFTYDGTMTWKTETVPLIESTPYGTDDNPDGYAPCDPVTQPDGIVCGDFCWRLCYVTRTGYWSDEIIEDTGQYVYCDPDTGVGICGPMCHRTMRYVLYPVCNLGAIYWVLEPYFINQDYAGGLPNCLAYPDDPPCQNVDCQLYPIGTSDPFYDCSPVNFSFSYLGSPTPGYIAIVEDG